MLIYGVLTLLAAISIASLHPQDAKLQDAFRKNQDGWVYLHLQGDPAAVGYQYGYLAAPEIDDAEKALKLYLANTTGKDWNWYRGSAQKVLWPKVEPEYRAEIQAIADGMRAKGFKEDTTDICAINGFFELAWYYLPYLNAKQGGQLQSNAQLQCSAFVATGNMTSDHRPVMAHNAWIDYILGERFNLILDVAPDKGYHFMMDAFPGFIDSGSDFAVNSQGIMFTETTIAGFEGFDPNGVPEFDRARKAIQYSKTLDDVNRIFTTGNNGGYANTWLMADNKTNEIGQLELGLKNVTFKRTSDGYFVGANFPQDPKLIAQECDPQQWPSKVCIDRHTRWDKLMEENKGQIDLAHAEAFVSDHHDETLQKDGPSATTLCGHADLDDRKGIGGLMIPDNNPFGASQGKAITAALADHLSFWGRMGHPCGIPFDAKAFFKAHSNFDWEKPMLRDMPTEPWSFFSAK
jgi:hypothetical protein